MYAGILEQIGHVNGLGIPFQADHILSQFHHPGRTGRRHLIFRHAAAKVQIGSAVLVHQHRRVKEPQHFRAGGSLPGYQSMADGIGERPGGAVRRQHADAAAPVREIQEKFILAIDIFPGRRRGPGIVGPFGRPLAACRLYGPMIRKIHHVRRGDHIDPMNLAIAVLLDFLSFILEGIRRHIEVNPAVILHGIRIRPKPLGHQRVGILQTLVSLCRFYILKISCILPVHISLFLLVLRPGNPIGGRTALACRLLSFPGTSLGSFLRTPRRSSLLLCPFDGTDAARRLLPIFARPCVRGSRRPAAAGQRRAQSQKQTPFFPFHTPYSLSAKHSNTFAPSRANTIYSSNSAWQVIHFPPSSTLPSRVSTHLPWGRYTRRSTAPCS